jgi:hypothetical protein
MFLLSYSIDSKRPVCDWTTETYTTHAEAIQAAIELLDTGYYLTLSESD